ncbi:VOC family protein [Acuticoccus sp. I52.16.1]|uniref:VOC family protein n=1 Tax=Acuticoccus sp. I52.16.1 TaxID=2928472 RepID=UPI00352D484C
MAGTRPPPCRGSSPSRPAYLPRADHFAAEHRRLVAAGVEFEVTPRHETYGTVAVCRDPYGDRWVLLSARSDPRAGHARDTERR